jgi:hypothetical protein
MTAPTPAPTLRELRAEFHARVCASVLGVRGDPPVPNNADADNVQSAAIAVALADALPYPKTPRVPTAQGAGAVFAEELCRFLRAAFARLSPLRPAPWLFFTNPADTDISRFDQYSHLAELRERLERDRALRAMLGGDYIVCPDIVIARHGWTDEEFNAGGAFVGGDCGTSSVLRARWGEERRILHASVSCKWTIRSDRAQNSRTEALNLLRNRRGRAPHIVVATAEPLPSRLASIAYGLGDVDCVYHLALNELRSAVHAEGNSEAQDALEAMIEGRRLADVADLPLDLAT